MSDSINSNFTEVITIEASVQAFTDSLAQLETAYKEFLGRLGSAASAVVNVDAFSGVQESIGKITNSFDEFLGHSVTSFSTLSEAAIAAFAKVEQALSANTKAQLEDIDNVAAAHKAATEAADTADAESTKIRLADLGKVANAQSLIDSAMRGEGYTEGQIKAAQSIAVEQEGIINKSVEDTVRLEQRWNAVNASIEKVNNSLRVAQLSDKPAEQLAELQRQLAAVVAQLRQIDALKNASSSGGTISSANVDILARENTLLKEQESLTRQVNTAQTRLASDSKGFFGTLNGDILDSVASLTKFTLVWAAIQTAIQAVTTIIAAPFKAIQEGLSFMQQMETKAAELAPALLQNVKFSDDLGQNFVKATDAAKQLVALIRDRSVVTGLDQTQITKLVEALVGSAAKEGVRNLEDMVTLAEAFALAMKTSGLGALNIQQQVSSITKLFAGKLSEESSRFLQKLGITTAEWEQINTQGQLHGDLLQRLTPYLEKYQQANALVVDTQDSLLKQLDLMKQKFEAAFASTIFDGIKDALKDLVDFLKRNQDAITQFLTDAGRMIANFISALADLAKAMGAGSPLLQGLKAILAILSGIVALSTTTLDTLSLIFQLSNPLSNWADISESFKTYAHNITDTATALTKTLTDLYSDTPVNMQGHGKMTFDPLPPPDISKAESQKQAIKEAEQVYTEEINKIKAKQKELIESTEELVRQQKLSHKEAADQIKTYLDQEALDIAAANAKLESAANALKDKINSATNTTSAQKATATQAITDAVVQIEQRGAAAHKALTDAISRETRQGYNDDAQAAKEHFNALIKLTQEAAVQQLAIDKGKLSEGLIWASQYYDEALKVAQDQYRDESIIIAEQIAAHQHVPVELQKDLDKQAELDQAYTAKVKQLTEERNKATEDEIKAKGDYFAKLKTLQTTSATEANTILTTLSGTSYITDQEMQLYAAKQQTLAVTQQQKQAELEMRELRGEESKQTRQLTLDIQGLYNQRLQLLNAELQQIRANNSNSGIRNVLSTSAVQNVYGSLVDEENAANKNLSQFQSSTTPGKPLTPDQAAELDALSKAAHDAAAAVGQMQAVFDRLHPSISKLFSEFVGFDFKAAWNSAEDAIGKVAVASNAASEGLKTILNLASVYSQGEKQGGALGGAGSVVSSISSGPLGALLFGKDSIVSQFLPAIGGVLSFIGGLFTAAAQKIADNVKKSFQATLDNYNNGNATLVETINTLEQQRSQAIASLSGKKGGQDQLAQLLPQFDQQIASLAKQQKDIITSFEQSLGLLQLHSDTLSGIEKQWEDINKQVADYINAGGDMAKAAQYLSISLQNIQQDAQSQLNDAQFQAIQDAIQLNSLLKQRAQLIADSTQKVFDLTNTDSIELMQAGSVSRGSQILTLKQQNQEQLDALNAQITTLTTKVGVEKQIFNIASDTATLQQQSDALALIALDTQAQKWLDLKSIIESITPPALAGGLFTSSGMFASPVTINVGGISVTGTSGGTPAQVGQQVADALIRQMGRNLRSGTGYR